MPSHSHLDQVIDELRRNPRTWLVTGAGGFIGSNLVEALLRIDQNVVGLDNFATGFRHNLTEIKGLLTESQWGRFQFYEGDIRDLETCKKVCHGVDVILHEAALGSVPRSINNPLATNETNVSGFLNVLVAAKDSGMPRVVFASSSSVYGDNTDLPKTEARVGRPLSPYAVSKAADELYGMVFGETYGMPIIGLRYFNVFGPRQTPNGPYAAVIPKWVGSILNGQTLEVFGDGETSRDFCYVKNVIQMNLLAATVKDKAALNRIYNTAYNARTSLNQLLKHLGEKLKRGVPGLPEINVVYKDRRPGDIADSLASIDLATNFLRYQPIYDISSGLDEALPWYVKNQLQPRSS